MEEFPYILWYFPGENGATHWQKEISRIILRTIIVLIILGALLVVISPPLVRNIAKKSFPQTEGEIQIPGLLRMLEIPNLRQQTD